MCPLLIMGARVLALWQGNFTRVPIVSGLLVAELSTRNGPRLSVSSAAGESCNPAFACGRKHAQAFRRQTEEHLAVCGRR